MARQHPLQDRDQRLVTTPYGRGLVIRTRPEDGMQDIQLLDWEISSTKNRQPKPMLHSRLSYKSVVPMVGDDVLCVYGRGRVISIRPPDLCVVQLTSWRLAQRSVVRCYLDINQVQVVRKKTINEMDAWERVQHAQELKTSATNYFGKKDYEHALQMYAKAVDAVRYVQHDANSSNETRADLVMVMITCCNNAGTCCIHLGKWDMAIHYARSALVLIDALYEKRGLKIHSILLKDGLTDAKLFGEFKCKSLLLLAKGLAERGDYASAIDSLKQANDVITKYTADSSDSKAPLHSQQKEVKRLYTTCVQQKKALKQKEKQRAQAMFASPLKEDKESSVASKQASTNRSPIMSLSPEPTTPIATALDISNDELEQELEDVSDKTIPYKKSVSFADGTKQGFREMLSEEDADEEEIPWYVEHKEALVLSTVAGLAALSVVLLRSRHK